MTNIGEKSAQHSPSYLSIALAKLDQDFVRNNVPLVAPSIPG
jgi:hypothetical protein